MNKQIERGQLIGILFLSRIFLILTFSAQNDPSAEGSVAMFGLILALPIIFVAGWFIQKLLDNAPGCGLLEAAALVSPIWGKVVAVAVTLVCIMVALNTASVFYYFLDIVVYPNLSIEVFALVFAVTCIYGAYLGLEPLVRFALPVVIMMIVAMLMVIPLLWKDIRMVYLHSPLEFGWRALIPKGFQVASGNLELLVIACLAPATRSKPLKILAPLTVLNLLYVEAMFFLAATTMGNFAQSQAFPIYAMMASVETAVMQRMDVVYISTWILIAFLKCSLYLYLAQRALGKVVNVKISIRSSVLGILLFVSCLVVSHEFQILAGLFNMMETGGPFLIAVVALPITTLILLKWRRRKEAKA